jgi:hypothetical protein
MVIRALHGSVSAKTAVRSITGVNETSNANEADQRRAARKRYRVQYRALYDQLVEILFQLDPIGVHHSDPEKFVSRSDDDHGTIARGSTRTTSNRSSNKNSDGGTVVTASPARIPNA